MEKANDRTNQSTGLGAAALADLQLVQDIMSGLGVTSESIRTAMDALPAEGEPRDDFSEFSDDEWSTISPRLPAEPPQSNTMGNRQFVNAVLAASHRGGRWAEYPKKFQHSDAVRRRFGRWSHQGVWQKLAMDLATSALSENRKRQLRAVAERADRLVRAN